MYTDPFAHLVRMEEYRNVDQKILEKLPERPKRSHKGMFGKALCIAGSVNMAGAAYLCAGAAYRRSGEDPDTGRKPGDPADTSA